MDLINSAHIGLFTEAVVVVVVVLEPLLLLRVPLVSCFPDSPSPLVVFPFLSVLGWGWQDLS